MTTITQQNIGTSSNKDNIKKLSEPEYDAKLDRLMYLTVHLDNISRMIAVTRGELLVPGIPSHHEMQLVKDQVHGEIRKIRQTIKEVAC